MRHGTAGARSEEAGTQSLRRAACFAIAVCGALHSLIAPAEPTLLRTTYVVADIDRSIAFYRELGFVPERDAGSVRDPSKEAFPLNVPATRYRLAILASPDPASARLGLLAYSAPAPKPVRQVDRAKLGLGDAVLVVRVPDADEAYARLERAGARFAGPPRTIDTGRKDAQGRNLQTRTFFVFDPDGTLLEVVQSAPSNPAPPPAPAAAARPGAARALQVRRPNLVVADIDRSLALYRDVLGLPQSGPVTESRPTSYSYPVFNIPAGAKIRFTYLDVGDLPRGLGLTEVRGVPLERSDGVSRSGLVLLVSDVDAILDRVAKLGLAVVPPRLDPPIDGRAL